jgi:hypothetical protein
MKKAWVRSDRGLDEVPYGDEPTGTFADTPYRPDEEDELALDEPEALGDGEEEPRLRAAGAVVRAEWQRQVERGRRCVPQRTSALRKVFRAHRAVHVRGGRG